MVKLKREEKKIFVKNLCKELEGKNILLTEFKGLKSDEIFELRRGIKENGGKYQVVKNIFLSMVFDKLKMKDLSNFLIGPTGIVVIDSDFIKITKFLVKFSKEHENFKVNGGYIENSIFDKDKIIELSKLPSREELLAMLLNGIKAPLFKLAFVLNGIISKLVYALEEIKKKKEEK